MRTAEPPRERARASAPGLPAESRGADVLAAVCPAARGVFCVSQGPGLGWVSAEKGGSLGTLSLVRSSCSQS